MIYFDGMITISIYYITLHHIILYYIVLYFDLLYYIIARIYIYIYVIIYVVHGLFHLKSLFDVVSSARCLARQVQQLFSQLLPGPGRKVEP